MIKEFVICYYAGGLEWIKQITGFDQIHVFDKSNSGKGIPQKNVGREHYTYLKFIIERYNSLPDITVFAQGWPFDHRENFLECVNTLPDDIEFVPLGEWHIESDELGLPHEQLLYGGIPLKRVYEELFEQPFPDRIRCYANSMFAVSRERILKRPREFYEKMLTYVDYDHTPIETYVFERLWHIVFGEHPDYPEIVLPFDT